MTLIFVASLNENMVLANTLQAQLKALGEESKLINLVHLQLAMYDTDKEQKEGIPEAVTQLIGEMENASGYLVVSPEYNYSIPPVLSNFVAWCSRAGDDFRKVFSHKVMQLATHSGSGGGDLMLAMRIQFGKLGALIMPREIMTTNEKALNKESSQKILQDFLKVRNTCKA